MQLACALTFVVLGCITTAVAQDRPPNASAASPAVQTIDPVANPAAFGARLREKAEQGDRTAQYLLGSLSEIAGQYSDAASWYRRSAEQGDPLAQGSLGRLYVSGQGVLVDYVQAYKWSRAAADQDDPLGEFTIATVNALGNGRPVDAREALVWARKAAEQDCESKFRLPAICAQAQAMLGDGYLVGAGVPQDYIYAYMWANLAAATLPADNAMKKVATTTRDLAASQMTREQMGEAQRLAREWKPRREQ